MNFADVVDLLEHRLGQLFGPDEIDVERDKSSGDLEVMTDDWTLHLDCRPDGLAWLALDTDPESPEEARALREEVMTTDVVRALADVDDRLNGALSSALAASDDLLSIDLVAAMAEVRLRSAGTANTMDRG